jgi:hypothetical protein
MNFEEYKEKIELILNDNKNSFDEFKNIQQYKESVNKGKQTGNYEIPEGVDAMGAFKQTTPKSHRIYFNAIAGVALNRFRTS